MSGQSGVREWLQWHSIRAHVVASIWLRVPEKQRWRIVGWLDRSRRFCWADLVSAALTYRETDLCDVHTPWGTRADRCASTCDWMHPDCTGEHTCRCYCGKFQFTAMDGAMDRRALADHGPRP